MSKLIDDVTSWSELVLAVFGVIAVMVAAMKSLYKIARNVEKLVETSDSHTERLAVIEKQVTLNGGTSMRDAVGRIEERLAKIESVTYKPGQS